MSEPKRLPATWGSPQLTVVNAMFPFSREELDPVKHIKRLESAREEKRRQKEDRRVETNQLLLAELDAEIEAQAITPLLSQSSTGDSVKTEWEQEADVAIPASVRLQLFDEWAQQKAKLLGLSQLPPHLLEELRMTAEDEITKDKSSRGRKCVVSATSAQLHNSSQSQDATLQPNPSLSVQEVCEEVGEVGSGGVRTGSGGTGGSGNPPPGLGGFRPVLLRKGKPLPTNWETPGGIVVLIDKPKGWTSFAVCGRLRSVTRIKKVGHAGTLDPMATGLLIVCMGKATKLADSYQAMVKEYSGTLRLGEATPSYDADTEVSERQPWEHISDADLDAVSQSFVGDIMQTPPMYSAIKVKGEKMYNKARRGEHVDLPPRPIKIFAFSLQRDAGNPQLVHFSVVSSKGTYIRSLCSDVARQLGSCAHLTALRRDKIGDYSVEDAWGVLDFVDAFESERQTPLIEKTLWKLRTGRERPVKDRPDHREE